jgi:ureidoglycolate hydrolase
MKIKTLALSEEVFAPYGSYMLLDESDKDKTARISFYPEKVVGLFEFSNMPSVSVLAFSKRDFIIDVTERHEHTEEIFGGFTTDTIFHVAAAGGAVPDPSLFKAFLLPKGGYVRLKRNVWHHAPFAVADERAVGVVILPPFTYTHDCLVVKVDERIQIEV